MTMFAFGEQQILIEPPAPPRKEDLPVTWRGFGEEHGTGLDARLATWDRWREEFGGFGCLPRSRTWHPSYIHRRSEGSGHAVCIFDVDLRCDDATHWTRRRTPGRCSCVGDLMYRAVCSCGWESTPADRENEASEALVGHLWPDWKSLPEAPRWQYMGPGGKAKDKALHRWLVEALEAGYDEDQLRAGGPIRTARPQFGTRHVEGGTPFGGYDLSMPAADLAFAF